MVSSYLVCDVCGGFGPPASFLSVNGLRLCYQCWYQDQCADDPSIVNHAADLARPDEPVSGSLNKPETDPALPAQSRRSS